MNTENSHEDAQNQSNGRYLILSFPIQPEKKGVFEQNNDEQTWIANVNANTNQELVAWYHTGSPNQRGKIVEHCQRRRLYPQCFGVLKESCLLNSWDVVRH